jgi:hypothetical protein
VTQRTADEATEPVQELAEAVLENHELVDQITEASKDENSHDADAQISASLGLEEITRALEDIWASNDHTKRQTPSAPATAKTVNDSVNFLRNNVIHGETQRLRHFGRPDIGNEIAEFLTTLEPQPRPITQRPVGPSSKWPCQDPHVREVFLDFERRFREIVKDLDLTQQQRDRLQLKAECLVSPGGGFGDAVMCLLNYPTFSCGEGETYYGSTNDLGNPCVRALANVLGGLQGLSTCPYNSVYFSLTAAHRHLPRRCKPNPPPASRAERPALAPSTARHHGALRLAARSVSSAVQGESCACHRRLCWPPLRYCPSRCKAICNPRTPGFVRPSCSPEAVSTMLLCVYSPYAQVCVRSRW